MLIKIPTNLHRLYRDILYWALNKTVSKKKCGQNSHSSLEAWTYSRSSHTFFVICSFNVILVYLIAPFSWHSIRPIPRWLFRIPIKVPTMRREKYLTLKCWIFTFIEYVIDLGAELMGSALVRLFWYSIFPMQWGGISN